MQLKYYVKIQLRCLKETKVFEFEKAWQVTKFIEQYGQQGQTFIIELR